MSRLITKALHLLPPETAHDVSLWALKRGYGPTGKPDAAALETEALGWLFSNPIGLAAGADKKAEALQGWTKMGFGFVEAGTVTLYPRAGNPKPRLWRVGDGRGKANNAVINWMGLPGDGLAPFVENLKKFSTTPERKKLGLGVSIGSPEGMLDDFRKIAAACAPYADYMTVNVSCPNVAEDAYVTAQSVVDQIQATRDACGGLPVLLKIGPTRDAEVLKAMVGMAMEAGATGIIATNTMPFAKRAWRKNDNLNWPQHRGQPVGGYSGPALLETSCWMIAKIRELIGKEAPLIGVGGIQSGANAVRMMQAGANLIQLYTGLIYKGPELLGEIKAALNT